MNGWRLLALLLLALPASMAVAADDDQCLACHRDPALQLIQRGPHGVAADPRTPAAGAGCSSCHVVSGEHPAGGAASVVAFGSDAATPVDTQNATCSGCHESDLATWHGGGHERSDVGCASCHQVHVARDPMADKLTQSETCFTCHRRERVEASKAFAHPLREGVLGCGDCHVPHGGRNLAGLRRPTINETCYECHAEKRGPFLFEHPPVIEDCGLCHQPHGSSHPGMLTRRAPFLCQQCHSEAGHPSLANTPGGLPGNTPSPFLLSSGCQNCHAQVHGSNHPSGFTLMR